MERRSKKILKFNVFHKLLKIVSKKRPKQIRGAYWGFRDNINPNLFLKPHLITLESIKKEEVMF
jgi:hypothetical protein